MEVFDPSPQVRRGGWAEGRGRSRGPRAVGWRDPGEERGASSARRGEGRRLAPSACGFMIDGRLARDWAAVLRSRRRQSERLSPSLPRVPCCSGTGSSGLRMGVLAGGSRG